PDVQNRIETKPGSGRPLRARPGGKARIPRKLQNDSVNRPWLARLLASPPSPSLPYGIEFDVERPAALLQLAGLVARDPEFLPPVGDIRPRLRVAQEDGGHGRQFH